MITDDKFEKLLVDVGIIKEKLEKLPDNFKCIMHVDHEKRIRGIEKFAYLLTGALILINACLVAIEVLVKFK